jgi:hypothetical protein
MIFSPELAELVVTGRKTETRRKVREGELCRYKVGRTYAVQPGRTKHGIGRIRVTEMCRERLGDIDVSGARREGFPTVGWFFDYWRRLHGGVDPEQEVWVIRFVMEQAEML